MVAVPSRCVGWEVLLDGGCCSLPVECAELVSVCFVACADVVALEAPDALAKGGSLCCSGVVDRENSVWYGQSGHCQWTRLSSKKLLVSGVLGGGRGRLGRAAAGRSLAMRSRSSRSAAAVA